MYEFGVMALIMAFLQPNRIEVLVEGTYTPCDIFVTVLELLVRIPKIIKVATSKISPVEP